MRTKRGHKVKGTRIPELRLFYDSGSVSYGMWLMREELKRINLILILEKIGSVEQGR